MKKYHIDLHVHTGRYSQCAEALDPYLLDRAARESALDGLVITEHDAIWTDEEIAELRMRFGKNLKIYRGVEVSSSDGHFVVIGMQKTDKISVGISLAELFSIAAEYDAAIILVHPHRSDSGRRIIEKYPNWSSYLHAVEVASTYTHGGEEKSAARHLATLADLAMVAGSDAHCLDNVGIYSTEFDFLPEDEAALAAAIKSRAGSPYRHS